MTTENIYQPGPYQFKAPQSIHLVHRNGHHRIVRLGFCWLGCLLPPVWALSEGLWRPFALSLCFFAAGKIDEIAALACQQSGLCAALTHTPWLKLATGLGYLVTMGYFGLRGQDMLVADLLKHGYFVEGTPYPMEPDKNGQDFEVNFGSLTKQHM